MFEKYEHSYGDSGKKAIVWVFKELKGKHRLHCLCYNCKLFKPGSDENCEIAKDTFKNCIKHDLVTPVYECPKFDQGSPDFSKIK